MLAARYGFTLATSNWLERTVADVAFDSFAFGGDVLYGTFDGGTGVRGALERGRGDDGVILAVGSVEWQELPQVWIAVQSKRSRNHLDLDESSERSVTGVGHARFDDAFDLDADDDAMDIVRSVLTDELCDWAVDIEVDHGPLTVIFDGGEDATHEEPAHGSAVFVARETIDDESFVETLTVTIELVTRFRAATDD